MKKRKGGLISKNGMGLLVVDVQTKLLPFIANKSDVVENTVRMIDIAHHLEVPILVAEQYVKGLGPTVPAVRAALERVGAYRPIEKKAFSCFGEPRFVAHFETFQFKTLALVGIEAHVCVMQTALAAMARGIEVYLIAEATGSRNPEFRREGIRRVERAGAIVGSTEMFAFELMESSAHPTFKPVQQIIM